MSEFTLTAAAPLGGYDRRFGDTRLCEVWPLAIVSLAIPLDGEDAFAEALRRAFDLTVPAVGGTATGGETTFLRLAADQLFALSGAEDPFADRALAERLSGTVYTTLQSDNWTALRLSGPLTGAALARLCPLDLSEPTFPVGNAARTVMEHLGVIVMKEAADRFLLLSASSSAASFLEAVETSIVNVME